MSVKMKNGAAGSSLKDVIEKDSILYKWASHDDASFHNFTQDEATNIRNALLSWYRANRRSLPWRGDAPPFDGSTAGVNHSNSNKKSKKQKNQPSITNFFATTKQPNSKECQTKDEEAQIESISSDEALPITPYGVWVSEIMLQQTRVEAVIPFYLKWIKRFPTVEHLANASEEDVNSHWAGLGFYRRARLLHNGAKKVVQEFDGQLPESVNGLMEIDGIGRYTACAIASIAFHLSVPVVDGNVCRVLSRLRGIANHIKAPILKDDVGWKLAEQIVSAGDGKHAGEVNQALMELGATYCSPSGTGIDERDPLKDFYMSPQIGAAFVEEQRRLVHAGFDTFPTDEYVGEAFASRKEGCICKVCDGKGVYTVLDELTTAAESLYDDANACAKHIGHSVFPTDPPKKAKREEVLSVAALSYLSSDDSVERWLLVRRPSGGLLSGQWEFPSVCVWTSESETPKSGKKRKNDAVPVPMIDSDDRVQALNDLLKEYTPASSEESQDWLVECPRTQVGEKPIEHIFSHIRHTMWVEHGDGSRYADSSYPGDLISEKGKELRWMSESDMKDVGITAGVKKILKAVKEERKNGSKSTKRSHKKSKK
eukprot:CAMPEP_0202486774 /NCGR_PEP_ID=MMETSP1361-20130828/5253_1 /ASSEMBLY_ACC=CAM_ASM_000849 /TAXON_ID=210615 /ORGANISM="Staurosira complex sp., Strain CCMP2646" /LENGTH=596 /DNA_ID=CAMNT_0049116003 /DNA_START=93 /DNA_END=1883 /DNA_ORIENTATION=+